MHCGGSRPWPCNIRLAQPALRPLLPGQLLRRHDADAVETDEEGSRVCRSLARQQKCQTLPGEDSRAAVMPTSAQRLTAAASAEDTSDPENAGFGRNLLELGGAHSRRCHC
jgi:hypothetical protein